MLTNTCDQTPDPWQEPQWEQVKALFSAAGSLAQLIPRSSDGYKKVTPEILAVVYKPDLQIAMLLACVGLPRLLTVIPKSVKC